jgi:hypothetical protein
MRTVKPKRMIRDWLHQGLHQCLLKWSAIGIGLIALSGCETGHAPRGAEAQRMQVMASQVALDQSDQVIHAFYELGFQDTVSPGARYRYDHSRVLPVMNLDGYRTFVKGLRIETASGQLRSIALKSLFVKPSAFGTAQRLGMAKQSVVLFPSILLLDEQLQLLADIKRPEFVYNQSASVMADAMVAAVTVPGTARSARYMVMYVDAKNRLGTFQYCRDGGAGMIRFNSTALPEYHGVPCFAVPFSLEGRLEVTIE